MEILLISLAPIFAIGWYIYYRDKDKESTELIRSLAIAGVLSAILTLIMTAILNTFHPIFQADEMSLSNNNLFVYVFVTIALIEEFSKGLLVYLIAWRHKEFDQSFDAIVYSVFVSLGFAGFENILYIVANISNMYKVAFSRALTAIPAHAICGILMGYLISQAKKAHHNNQNFKMYFYIIMSLLVPTLIHTIYDWILFAQFNPIIFIAFVILIFMTGFTLIYIESKNNKKLREVE